MIWNCSICICRLEGNKPTSCTPCGHIFHSDCLKGWISNSQTCPECRRKVSPYNSIRLYPFEKSSSSTLDASTLEYDFLAAKEEIKEKMDEINSLKNRIEELNVYVAKAESAAEAYRQEKMDNANKLRMANLRLQKIKDMEQQIRNLEISLSTSTAELDLYKNVKTVIHGQQQDVDKILEEAQKFGCGDEKAWMDSMKQLATYSSTLKREFLKTVDTKNSYKDEVSALKTRNSSLNHKHLKMKETCDMLKQQIAQLEKENLNCSKKVCANCSSLVSPINNNTPVSVSEPSISNSNDSPITVNFSENRKKIDVLVLDDDCNKQMPTTSKFISRRGQDGIATRINYGLWSGKTQDPKLFRRIKVPSNERGLSKKHVLAKNSLH